jgi:hypothetical protein
VCKGDDISDVTWRKGVAKGNELFCVNGLCLKTSEKKLKNLIRVREAKVCERERLEVEVVGGGSG